MDLSQLHWPLEADTLSRSRDDLDTALHRIRDLPYVDDDRIALWAFSGGALVVADQLDRHPSWLRSVALSYPVMFDPDNPVTSPYRGLRLGCPLVLTRVGQESPDLLAEVDRYLATPEAADVEVLLLPDGHHGFDVRDESPDSRSAITAAMTFVADQLA